MVEGMKYVRGFAGNDAGQVQRVELLYLVGGEVAAEAVAGDGELLAGQHGLTGDGIGFTQQVLIPLLHVGDLAPGETGVEDFHLVGGKTIPHRVGEETGLPIVAALHDMLRLIDQIYARATWHGISLILFRKKFNSGLRFSEVLFQVAHDIKVLI